MAYEDSVQERASKYAESMISHTEKREQRPLVVAEVRTEAPPARQKPASASM